jgi:hypothetical protein
MFNGNQYLENCCVKCEVYFTNAEYKWCKSCQIDWLRKNFTNWTSESKQLNNLIQKKQLSISDYNDTIFEWIPYDQFIDIKELNNTTTYSARWKNGPYNYIYDVNVYLRNLGNKVVILKYLVNLQNITNEFLNEVNRFSTNLFNIFYYINIFFYNRLEYIIIKLKYMVYLKILTQRIIL